MSLFQDAVSTPIRNGSVKLRTVSEGETVHLLPKNMECHFNKQEKYEEEEE